MTTVTSSAGRLTVWRRWCPKHGSVKASKAATHWTPQPLGLVIGGPRWETPRGRRATWNAAHLWAPVLGTIGPALLVEAQNALDNGERMVGEWLETAVK